MIYLFSINEAILYTQWINININKFLYIHLFLRNFQFKKNIITISLINFTVNVASAQWMQTVMEIQVQKTSRKKNDPKWIWKKQFKYFFNITRRKWTTCRRRCRFGTSFYSVGICSSNLLVVYDTHNGMCRIHLSQSAIWWLI